MIRNLEIVGEAVKHVPFEVREDYPDLEWRKIAGLCDVVAHEYFGIDWDVIWDIARNKVPALLAHVAEMLPDLENGNGPARQ